MDKKMYLLGGSVIGIGLALSLFTIGFGGSESSPIGMIVAESVGSNQIDNTLEETKDEINKEETLAQLTLVPKVDKVYRYSVLVGKQSLKLDVYITDTTVKEIKGTIATTMYMEGKDIAVFNKFKIDKDSLNLYVTEYLDATNLNKDVTLI